LSISRQTEIMEKEIVIGWTATKITATGVETKTVKATPGKIARIKVVTGAITIIPKNGTTAIWDAIDNTAEFNQVGSPIQCNTSINLTFSGAGDAWIIYK